MSFLFSESKVGSKRAGLVRTITMLGYFIVMFGTSFIFSWGMQAVDTLFNTFTSIEPSFVLITILSLIPFLVAPAFFVSLGSIQFQAHPILILTTITGFALSIVLTWAIFKIAQRALQSAISTEVKAEKKVEKKEIQFEIKADSPIKAYLRKDLVSSTRDIQSFMFIFFPIFYPLIMILSMMGIFNEFTITPEAILIVWSIILMVYMFIPIMLIVGFLNIEESGSSTLASLPLIPRDQAKAKILLMFSIQGVSLILTSIVLTILMESFFVLMLLLITVPIAWTLLLFMFVLKIKFFGQMKYKYILEELHKENKIIKWIVMVLSEIGLYMVILITGIVLIFIFDITLALIVLGIIGLLSFALMLFIFNRMFPKVEKIAEYKTGGFLRENVNWGTLVVLVLYVVFFYLTLITTGLLSPLYLNLPIIWIFFIGFFIEVGFLILLWQITVPLGLKLPNGKQTFKQHSYSIGLTRVKPLWRNLIIGIGSFAIIGCSALLIGSLFGDYIFNPEILITGNNWMLFFVYMLIPGIWEEISFRGVILNLQLRKYSKTTVILLNGILFGLFHFVNILFGQPAGPTSVQVIFASCLGISLAYIFIKTNSLLPCIILHYLFDAIGTIFQTFNFPNGVFEVLFVIIGLGFVPMILITIFVKLITRERVNSISREID